ncbi:hypothetical protein Syun_026007 [Stephania yunnanensis]|uniref:DUF4283 domain-containing protein n=1 Tax=Stephania yunnanensis TaxID=152371 RepID=A0AAP0EVL9_9MAGN
MEVDDKIDVQWTYKDRLMNTGKRRFSENILLEEVVKLQMGKALGFKMLCNRIEALWHPEGEYRVMDLHVLSVQKWVISFRVSTTSVSKAAVRIRFPDLPPGYFHDSIKQRIYSLASVSGRRRVGVRGRGGRGHESTVRRGRRLFKEGRRKRSVERDTAEGGFPSRGRLGKRDRRRCTRATEKEERRIGGASEQGAAAAEALISSSGSGTWRK